MSLYGAFAKARHFLELADNDTDQHGNLLTPTARRNEAFRNLTGNTTITAAEVAGLSGAGVANSGTSVGAFLDSGGDIVTASNVGTSAATSVKEYGDGFNHVTVLTCTALTFNDEPDNESVAMGDLIYTFPAGAIILDSAYMNISFLQGGTPTTDTPDMGLGTVIGTGVVTTLDGTAEFEDIITGQTMTDVAATATVVASIPSVGAPLFIASGDAHTVPVNAADAWQDITNPAITYTGVVVLIWKFLE